MKIPGHHENMTNEQMLTEIKKHREMIMMARTVNPE